MKLHSYGQVLLQCDSRAACLSTYMILHLTYYMILHLTYSLGVPLVAENAVILLN